MKTPVCPTDRHSGCLTGYTGFGPICARSSKSKTRPRRVLPRAGPCLTCERLLPRCAPGGGPLGEDRPPCQDLAADCSMPPCVTLAARSPSPHKHDVQIHPYRRNRAAASETVKHNHHGSIPMRPESAQLCIAHCTADPRPCSVTPLL